MRTGRKITVNTAEDKTILSGWIKESIENGNRLRETVKANKDLNMTRSKLVYVEFMKEDIIWFSVDFNIEFKDGVEDLITFEDFDYKEKKGMKGELPWKNEKEAYKVVNGVVQELVKKGANELQVFVVGD